MPTTDPPDLELLIYQRIWQRLIDYAPWKADFEDGNIIRFDRDESSDDPEKDSKADGDYPEAMMESVGGSSSGRETDPTFGTYALPDGCAHWVERQTHAFRLTITSRKLSMLEQSRQRKLTLNALRLAGPRLGLDFVTKTGFRYTVARESSGDADGTYRQKTTIDIAVETEADGHYLTGES